MQRMPSWYERSNSDVFALVKAFVSDPDLSQPALLVMPGGVSEQVAESLRKIASNEVPCYLA